MISSVLTLIVYAYSSFVSSWGPGPAIAKEFEKTCQCQVKLVDVGDAGSLLSRLKLEKDKPDADIALGFDESILPKVKEDLGWKTRPVMFDQGPFAFVYNTSQLTSPPHSLDDLLLPQYKGEIVIEDPRLSSAGLGFLFWVIKEKGEPGAWDYLKKLKPQLKMVTPSWDLAYGMFKKGLAKLVFSYWTSPAYHIQEEKRHDIKAVAFKNGNYVQREYFVFSSKSENEGLRKKFGDFLLEKFSQELLAQKNFMYPVNKKAKLPPAFDELGKVKQLPSLNPTQSQINNWLKKWREIFS